MPDNALIDLSAGLINAAVERDIDQTDKVRDVILGNPVYGKARTRARVGAVLVPDTTLGIVDLVIRGTTLSDTVAVPPERNLLVYSTTCIPFVLSKRLLFSAAGIQSYPSEVRASASAKLIKVTDLKGQTGTLRTTLAEEGFDISKERAEAIAVSKERAQLSKQTDDEIQPQIVKGNEAFAQALQQFKSMGVPLRQFHFSTTRSLLTLGTTLSTNGQDLPSAPPPHLTGPMDLAARVHQSAVNDTAQAVLGGKTFNVSDLKSLPGTANMAPAHAQLVQHCLGTLPHTLGVSVLAVTFADAGPISVVFADHCVSVTVRLKEIRAAGLRLPGLTMKARYAIENRPGAVELVRQGPVQVEPFHHTRIGNRVLGAVLQGGLDHVFKARIPVPSLTAPAQLRQIGTLAPVHGDACDGWLVLTWKRC